MGFLTDVTDFIGLTDTAGAERAARESASALEAAGREGIETQRQMFEEYLAPYAQAGQGALGRAIDFIGGRRVEKTPAEQYLMDEALERVNREAAYTGGLGGGQRLKRLQQTSLNTLDQIRQRRIGNELQLAGLGQSAAMGAQNVGRGISDLQTDIGSARASGIIGEQQAGAQARDLVATVGGQALGAYIGGLG